MADEQFSELLPEPAPKDFFRVCVADDEPVARRLLGAVLEAAGYTNRTEVERGDAAIELLAREPVHLMLLDKNMPGADGLEVLRRGRELRPGCEFILITAFSSVESAIEAIDLGAYSYIKKPFADADVVVKRVEGALDRVRVRLENEVLLDRLRMLLGALERLEAGRGGEPSEPDEELLARVGAAAGRLRLLAERLERLRRRAKGSARELIGELGQEMDGVARLLANGEQPAPSDEQGPP
jgi:DNA-binding response OmpR family regulator